MGCLPITVPQWTEEAPVPPAGLLLFLTPTPVSRAGCGVTRLRCGLFERACPNWVISGHTDKSASLSALPRITDIRRCRWDVRQVRKADIVPFRPTGCTRSPEITGPIHTDGRPMPTAKQPFATGKRVRPTDVIPTDMDMPVFLPVMPLYAIVTGDSGRHEQQNCSYSRDEENFV